MCVCVSSCYATESVLITGVCVGINTHWLYFFISDKKLVFWHEQERHIGNGEPALRRAGRLQDQKARTQAGPLSITKSCGGLGCLVCVGVCVCLCCLRVRLHLFLYLFFSSLQFNVEIMSF